MQLENHFHKIRDGYQDVMITGGAEGCICPMGVGGFTVMQALSTSTDPNRASIPFDAERGGFVMGEGAGILILEELEHAKARGAKIYGEVVGYGASCDAYHITAPDPTGAGAAGCMKMAIQDAGIEKEMLITSTPMVLQLTLMMLVRQRLSRQYLATMLISLWSAQQSL